MPEKGLGIWKVRPMPMRGNVRGGQVGDVLAVEDHLAGVGVDGTGDEVEPRGLAGPVGTDDTESLTFARR